jgi:hypothetical protein
MCSWGVLSLTPVLTTTVAYNLGGMASMLTLAVSTVAPQAHMQRPALIADSAVQILSVDDEMFDDHAMGRPVPIAVSMMGW